MDAMYQSAALHGLRRPMCHRQTQKLQIRSQGLDAASLELEVERVAALVLACIL